VIEKVVIMRAQNVRLALDRSLQDNQVVRIAQWGAIVGIERHQRRDALQKLGVFQKFRIVKAVKLLEPGVAEDFCDLGDDLIRENQPVALFEQGSQKTPRQ
jgi:hypothetical protein